MIEILDKMNGLGVFLLAAFALYLPFCVYEMTIKQFAKVRIAKHEADLAKARYAHRLCQDVK